MEAIHFGAPRTLFGIRSEPTGTLRQTAVVICPSWGAEYMRAYRTLHLLAAQLAEAGFDVLRFDYSCTGDSDGDAEDARIDDWLDDIRSAAHRLRADSGAPRLCLFGIRLGALLAERAVAEGRVAAELALWDAPVDGQAWIDESRQLDVALRERKNRYAPGAALLPLEQDALLGMSFGPELAQEVAALRPRPVADAPVGVHFRSQDEASMVAGDDTRVLLPDEAHWRDSAWLTRPWTPARSIRMIAERLAARLR